MKHFMKAQAKLLVTVLTLVVVLGIGATVAYLHDTTGVVRNTFDAAQLDTKIEEELNTDEGTKKVVITNVGKSDAYVRARVMVSGVKDGQWEIISNKDEANNPAKVYLVMPYVNKNTGKTWSAIDEQEFYYYNSVLPGTRNQTNVDDRKTSQLLQAVIIGKDVLKDDPDFLDTFSVTITHESVLAGDYDDARTAFAAAENKS